jgi:error-prone DNA polymerase
LWNFLFWVKTLKEFQAKIPKSLSGLLGERDMSASFVHLRVHSYYSLMQGVSAPEALCQAAAEAGMEYLALTDTNGLYGLIRFLGAARKHGIHPLVGTFLQEGQESAVILAKTPKGYELLCQLLSRRHLKENFSLEQDFPESREHLALLSADTKLLNSLCFKAECWVEVIPGSPGRRALEIARSLELPPIATNAVYFARSQDHSLHRLVRAIDLNCTLSTLPPKEVVSPKQWLKSPEAMAAHFPHCPEALANTLRLARTCQTNWDRFPTVFPHYQNRKEDHSALLEQQCRAGIRWRYGAEQSSRLKNAIETRLTEELELVQEKEYVDYFLVVADIVRRRPIHCGRGSAAASLVSYLLGITHVDPLQHGLVFGRFLNPQRQDHPDIDVDFPWDERDDLLEEIRQLYGPQRFAMVANHVGFGGRAAVREVAKVYGIPAAEIKEVTRRLSGWTHPGRIRERVQKHPRFHEFSLNPPWPDIMELAARLESLPRHLSVHCGGIILAPDEISRYVPVQESAKGIEIIQWEKDQAEEGGLVKIDLLGNRSLAVIRDALAAIERNTGKTLDYASLNPLQDPATLGLLERGDTMGIFYVESPAMRLLQKKTGRGDFEHLVIHSSIIRPAANRYIREYIQRLHGVPYQPLHPSLKDLLTETYGVMVYQEDVIQVAMALAGFDWAEADGLRKVLSKKSREAISDYRKWFYEGCAHKKVPLEVVNTVWDMFISFSGYSFCKPHSASYALVSFKSAYLKAHYPAEFMAAVLSHGGGYYTTFAYISEARRMGLKVLGPHINESDWSYRGKDKTIRMGFQQLQGIRKETLEAILEERNRNGRFRSLEDLLSRAELQPAEGTMLVKSGALDDLTGALNRPQLLWWMEARLRGGHFRMDRGQRSFSLIPSRTHLSVPSLPDVAPQRKWQQEMETLGFVFSVHPLTFYESFLKNHRHPVVTASELSHYIGRKVWVVGWPITRKEVLTREGEPMEFVTFEDKTAIYETIFFPEAFKRFCQHLDRDHAYLLRGTVEEEFGAVSLVIQEMRRIPYNPPSD